MENSDFALFVFAAAPVTLLTLLSKSDVGKKVRAAVCLYLSLSHSGTVPYATASQNPWPYRLPSAAHRISLHMPETNTQTLPSYLTPQVQEQLEARLPELQAEAEQLRARHTEARARSKWYVSTAIQHVCLAWGTS